MIEGWSVADLYAMMKHAKKESKSLKKYAHVVANDNDKKFYLKTATYWSHVVEHCFERINEIAEEEWPLNR